MNEDWLSAHLDDELSAADRAELDAALAADPLLRATYDDVARVRSLVRGASVAVPSGALERIVGAVGADDDPARPSGADVVDLRARRRVPTFAAVAAAVVIIASVVGGLGGAASLPALGELIAQHEAAAAIIEGAPMPPEIDMMDEMPMDEAMTVALPMPSDYAMQHAFARGSMVQLVYMTPSGAPLSVFRHEGDADLGALGEGAMSRSDEAAMWSARAVDGARGEYVAVVDGTGYVWVVIGAEPPDVMMDELMHDLPTRSPSVGERLRGTADAAVEPFRFWG